MDEWQATHAELKPASYRPPRWFACALNERLPDLCENARLIAIDAIDSYLFDHLGTDSDGNFVIEPYCTNLADLEPHVSDLPALPAMLELHYAINPVAYRAKDCVRITFYKP